MLNVYSIQSMGHVEPNFEVTVRLITMEDVGVFKEVTVTDFFKKYDAKMSSYLCSLDCDKFSFA